MLVLLCAGEAGGAAAVRAATAIELVHMATLVHDDVLDEAPLRRGLPTVAATSGRARALATGDLLLSRAFALLSEAGDTRAVLLLADAAVALARGELAQRQDAFDLTITEERYLQRCRLKTAALFECAVSLGHDDPELRRFGTEVGLAFQLLDDVLDVTGPPERTGKARGTDLLDGTVTLPLIVAAEHDPSLREIDLPRARRGERRGGLRTDRRDRGAAHGAGAGARPGRRREAHLGRHGLRRRTAPAARVGRRRRGPAVQLIHERLRLVTIDGMLGNIGPLEIIVVLIIALIVFGPKRLPELGNSLGKGIREFKDSVTGDHDDDDSQEEAAKAIGAPAGDHDHAGQAGDDPSDRSRQGRGRPRQKSLRSGGMPRRVRAVSHEDQLSLVDHLDELRHRIVVCLVVFAVALALCFWQNHLLLEIAQHPLPSGHKKLTTFGVTEPFTTTLTVSAYGAAILSAPFILWELYAYVLPAFSPSEKRVVLPILLLFPFLFVGGIAFGYFAVMPAALHFLLGFNENQFNIQVRAGEYYSFFGMTMLACGLVFQLPMAILAVTRLGIVSVEQLTKNRRYAYLVIAIVAAALPGVDPVSMLIEMVPLLVLFELSILLARWFGRASEGAARPSRPRRSKNVHGTGE